VLSSFMPSLREITLQDVGPIKDITFKIQPGLSVVYGLNQAAGKNSENGNAVGKSLLLSSIPETIRGLPIIGERGDRVQEGVRTAAWTSHTGKNIEVRRSSNGRGDKLELFEDGKSLDFRTIAASKEYIDQHWPLTDMDYSTYGHIDSRSPHPLVMGTSAQRKEFFTEFFNLEILDAERKLYNSYLRELKNARAAYDEVNTQLASIQARRMSDEDRTAAEKDRDTLQDHLTELEGKVSSAQYVVRLIKFGERFSEEIVRLKKEYKNLDSEVIADANAEIWDTIRAKKAERSEVEGALRKAELTLRDYENYTRNIAKYTEAFEDLSPEARAAIDEQGLENALEQSGEAAQKSMKLKAQLDTLNEQLDALEAKLDAKLPAKTEAPAEDIEDLKVLERTYQHHLQHAKKFGSGVCDSCGQAVQTKDPDEVKDRLAGVREKLAQHAAAQAYADALAIRLEQTAKFNELDDKAGLIGEERVKLVKIGKIYKELNALPSKPAPFDAQIPSDSELDSWRSKLGELAKEIDIEQEKESFLKSILPNIDTINEFLKMSSEQWESAQELDSLSEKVRSTRERYTQALSKLSVENSLAQQITELRERADELAAKLKEESKIKVLVEAYSDKNIKKLVVEQIGTRLMALVNKYAQQVFEESYRFEFIWDTDISILAHRANGKVSDVRKLSGAESTLFTIILVCALLSFVPAKKRCNFMILDEPTSHMSAHNKEILHNALKLLNGLIPSIIIVTPKMEERYYGATEYTVVKGRDGISRLEEGHPDEVRGNA
jgi:DNA repair exonuclease SbcCD ATPase subunit